MAKEISFKSGGVNCAADLYLPKGPKRGKRPGLVIGHGFSLNKAFLTEQAAAFREAGFVVLAIDYRTFGNSGGRPRGQLFPLNEAEDYRNGISYLQSRRDVDADRIGIWGASFAGAVVSYVGAIDRRAKAVCAVVPVTDGYVWMKLLRSEDNFNELLAAVEADRAKRFAGDKGDRIPVLGPQGSLCGMPSDEQIMGFFEGVPEAFPTWHDSITLESVEKIIEFSPLSFVHRITPRPYLVISTSGRDIVHPAWSVTELFERAREPKRLEFLPFDQTGLYSEPGLTQSNNLAIEFFSKELGPID
jgi:uncharacterized protein